MSSAPVKIPSRSDSIPTSLGGSDNSDDTSLGHHGSYTVNGSMLSIASSSLVLSSTPRLERITAYDQGQRSKTPPTFVAPPPPSEPPSDLVSEMNRSNEQGLKHYNAGSLREVYKSSRTSIYNNPQVFSNNITDMLGNGGEGEETDYNKMTNALIQDYIRKTRIQEQPDKSAQKDSNARFTPPKAPSQTDNHSDQRRSKVNHDNYSGNYYSDLHNSSSLDTQGGNVVVALLDKRINSLGKLCLHVRKLDCHNAPHLHHSGVVWSLQNCSGR